MLIYLGVSAIAILVAALLLVSSGSASLPAAAHLLFAAGVVPLIFGAITHFVPVLTRSRSAPRSLLLSPLLLQLSGCVTFLAFVGEAPASALHAAAAGALLLALWLAGWLVLRARRTLGSPHPGWRWYLVAISFLALALMLVPAMSWWPEARPQLRQLHLHLNTLGFIGLTALGTLQVLLPTVLGSPDANAAERLRRDLPWATGAVLAVAIGSAFSPALALAGAAIWLAVTLGIGLSWLRRYGWRTLLGDGTAAALFSALSGFLLLIAFGVAHALEVVDGRDAVAALVIAFLLPLLTGALSQLLPVWYRPGRRTPARDRMHAALRAGGSLRSLLFLASGILLGLGINEGAWLAAPAILSFLIALFRAFLASGERVTKH